MYIYTCIERGDREKARGRRQAEREKGDKQREKEKDKTSSIVNV